MTWERLYQREVVSDRAWFLFHGQHPEESPWQRETRLAKYCRAMARQEWEKKCNYWERAATEHQSCADELSRAG